jgi:glyoxylase-like metal-dependent hydrolase (beta-lactamase superfamily II)
VSAMSADPTLAERRRWATSGVEEITSTVHRIPMSLPNDSLLAVNVYAIAGADGVGLIDGGWDRAGALEELGRGLAESGHALADITTVLSTHYHPDHYTLAVALRRELGVPIALGDGERHTVDEIIAGTHGLSAFGEMLQRAGTPEPRIAAFLHEGNQSDAFEHPTTWLTDGDRPRVGDRQLDAIATPGHTRGHFCFADDDAGLLFAGDHVLPHITPSIGFETFDGLHLPLADYLASLRRVRERPDARLLPAHGPVTASAHARVDELLHHHDVRLQRCLDALTDGAQTCYQVAQSIPWTRREYRVDELPPFDHVMAVHETRAHLEVLQMRGMVARDTDGDVDNYTAC